MKNEKLRKGIEHIILVILGLVILLICLIQTRGASIAPDSIEYIEMRSYLPALYPMFLWVLRFFFGEEYLLFAMIFQTILAVFCTLFLQETICRTFGLEKRYEMYLVFFFLIGVFFTGGTGIADGQGSANLWILTEGLSYSLFYLFVACDILFLTWYRKVYWIETLLLCGLLILCRDQFWACCGILLLEEIGLFFLRKGGRERVIEICSILLLCILTFGIQRGYTNYFRSGNDESFRRQTVITHYAFFMNEQDLEYATNDSDRVLLGEMLQRLSEEGTLVDKIQGDWLRRVTVYRKNFNETYNVISDVAHDYIEQNGLTMKPYEIILKMERCLQNHMKDWIYMSTVSLLPIILTMSVCIYIPLPHIEMLVIIYSCLIVFLYLCLLCYLFIKQKRFSKEVVFGCFVLIYLLVNGIGTTLAIRPIARYVFYSFGLFYISLYLMIRKTVQMEKKDDK